MRQDAGDRHEPPEPAPEPFDVFYSVAQVDAAGRLREIMRHSRRPVAHGRTPALPEQPPEPPGPPPPLLRPPAWPRRTPQRLALVVNLLLVLGLGVVLGVAATDRQDANGGAPVPAASTVAVTRPAIQAKVRMHAWIPWSWPTRSSPG